MTTVVVVRKDTRAVIAADTLARYGNTTETAELIANCEKIVQVDDAYLAPTGPASAQLVLRSYFSNPDRKRDFGGLDGIFETMRAMQGVLKEEYYLNPKEDETDPFDSIQMELLVASPAGIFGVYPLRSIQEYKRFYAFGSGAQYALGALQADWMRLDSAEEIATRAVEVAAALDDSTGLPLTIHPIDLGTSAFH